MELKVKFNKLNFDDYFGVSDEVFRSSQPKVLYKKHALSTSDGVSFFNKVVDIEACNFIKK